jgi:glycosyltransferase involved in cell wall biosynthesis
MKALILMSHMSDYMLNCFKCWHQSSDVELHIIVRKVDKKEAPFDFSGNINGVFLYNREDLSAIDICQMIDVQGPNLIICFGWTDPAYLAAVKARHAETAAVLTMDNQWRGSLRQFLGVIYFRLFLLPYFDFIWVPGAKQKKFALKLGFPLKKIYLGFYVANDINFSPIYKAMMSAPKKRIVFVGRYIDHKGVRELWKAFERYHASNDSTLELLSIGVGPLLESRLLHPRISHLGFLQPTEFKKILAEGGIFILPSKLEPWGVVVQEFALAGFPLLLSEKVGAADNFLTSENGRVFNANSHKAFVEIIAFADQLSPEKMIRMSHASHKLGASLAVSNWCDQANEFLRSKLNNTS